MAIVSSDRLDHYHNIKVTCMNESGERMQVTQMLTYVDEASAGHLEDLDMIASGSGVYFLTLPKTI